MNQNYKQRTSKEAKNRTAWNHIQNPSFFDRVKVDIKSNLGMPNPGARRIITLSKQQVARRPYLLPRYRIVKSQWSREHLQVSN